MTKKTKNTAKKTVLPKKSTATVGKTTKTAKQTTEKVAPKKTTSSKTKQESKQTNTKTVVASKKTTSTKKSLESKTTTTAKEQKPTLKDEPKAKQKLTENSKTKELSSKQSKKEKVEPFIKEDVKSTKNKDSKKTEINQNNNDGTNSTLPPIQTSNTSDYDLNKVDLDFENEVYDEADIASALEMGFIAQALEAHKAKVAKETHPDFDGESCIDCGEEIPQLRLSMGRIRCVYCQEALERKNKLHGR
jgi:RNA polymerase-binding transcription factor DksA